MRLIAHRLSTFPGLSEYLNHAIVVRFWAQKSRNLLFFFVAVQIAFCVFNLNWLMPLHLRASL